MHNLKKIMYSDKLGVIGLVILFTILGIYSLIAGRFSGDSFVLFTVIGICFVCIISFVSFFSWGNHKDENKLISRSTDVSVANPKKFVFIRFLKLFALIIFLLFIIFAIIG